jgi:hypothetical protein
MTERPGFHGPDPFDPEDPFGPGGQLPGENPELPGGVAGAEQHRGDPEPAPGFYDQEVEEGAPAAGGSPGGPPQGAGGPGGGGARPGGARRRNPRSRTPQRLGPPRRAHHGPRRLRIIAAIVVLLVIGALLDRSGGGDHPTAAAAAPIGPVAAPAGAESSSWFCAGGTDGGAGGTQGSSGAGTDTPKGSAPAQLAIANTNPQPLTATVTLIPVSGSPVKPATSTVTVGARSRTTVPEDLPGGPSWIGADVTLHGGAAAVDQEITSTSGPSVSPCATSGSRTWWFTAGRTAVNASDVVTLFNPYPIDSIVDLSFTTNQGLESPGEFQALDVPARGLIDVDLGSHLRRRTSIATAVTARSGQVIAWQTRVVTKPSSGTPTLAADGSAPAGAIDPASPVPGVVVSLGAPAPATSWTWPDGIAGNGVDEQYAIYNPGPGVAQVQLALHLDQGTAEPFTLSVGAEQVSTVISDQQARVPAGVTHSAVLRSTNGVPVVATREVAASSPSPHTGLGSLLGEVTPSPAWLFAGGSATSAADEALTLYNPGGDAVRVTVDGLTGGPLAPLPGVAPLVIGPGARTSIDLGTRDPSLASAFVVQATGPVYAERDVLGAQDAGYGLSAGVPLSG